MIKIQDVRPVETVTDEGTTAGCGCVDCLLLQDARILASMADVDRALAELSDGVAAVTTCGCDDCVILRDARILASMRDVDRALAELAG